MITHKSRGSRRPGFQALYGGSPQLRGAFPRPYRLRGNSVVRLNPVLLIPEPDQAADLHERADDRVGRETADHQRNRPEAERDPVVHPVRQIKQEEIAVSQHRRAGQHAAYGKGEKRFHGINQPGSRRGDTLDDGQGQSGHAVHIRQQAQKLSCADASGKEASEHIPGVPEGHVPLPLAPAHPLPDRCAELRGLFVVDPGAVIPQNSAALQRRLDLNLKVFGQRHGRPAAAGVKIFRRHREARAADRTVQAQPVLGQVEEPVAQRIARVAEPGNHAFLVLDAQVALNEIRSVFVQVLTVYLPEHIRVHQIVRVKDHHQIVPGPVISQRVQGFAQRDGLARRGVRRFLPGLDHSGPRFPGHFRGAVRAVVRDDIVVVELSGIIHFFQISDNIADHPFLVMRRNQHEKTGLGIMILVILLIFSETEKTDYKLIQNG